MGWHSPILTKCRDQGAKKPSNVEIKICGESGFLLDFPGCFLVQSTGKTQGQSRLSPTFSLNSRKVMNIFLDFKLKVGECWDCPRLSPISHKKIRDWGGQSRSQCNAGLGRFYHPDPILTRPDPIFVGIVSPSRYPAHSCPQFNQRDIIMTLSWNGQN